MLLQRRNFLIGIASSLAAPAIVHANILMPIKPILVRGVRFQHKSHMGHGTTFTLSEAPLSFFKKEILWYESQGYSWSPIY